MKVAIFILTHPDVKARLYRGLMAVQELKDAGDDVACVFDAEGVEALAAVSREDHPMHKLLESIREVVAGACGVCARSHGVEAEVKGAGFAMLGDHKGHASLRKFLTEGYQVVTF